MLQPRLELESACQGPEFGSGSSWVRVMVGTTVFIMGTAAGEDGIDAGILFVIFVEHATSKIRKINKNLLFISPQAKHGYQPPAINNHGQHNRACSPIHTLKIGCSECLGSGHIHL